jgi:hypothetical protein
VPVAGQQWWAVQTTINLRVFGLSGVRMVTIMIGYRRSGQ